MFQLATMMLPEEENFLLLFHRETPLDNSVEFMRVRSKIPYSRKCCGPKAFDICIKNTILLLVG
jgi:hypothetical protein